MSDSLADFEDEFSEIRPNGHATPKSESGMTVIKVIKIALSVVGENALKIFGAISTFCLFGYAILHPDILRIIIASLYGSIVFLPAMFKRREIR